MSSERTKGLGQPAPMIIPAIGYLSGILSIRALNVWEWLPSFIYPRLNAILLSCVFVCIGGFLSLYLWPRYRLIRFSGACYALGVATLFFAGAWSYCRQNNLSPPPQNNELTFFYGKVERVSETQSGRFMRVNTRLLTFCQGDHTVQCNSKVFIYIPIERYAQSMEVGAKVWGIGNASLSEGFMPPAIFLSRSDPFGFTHVRTSFPSRWGQKLLARLKAKISDPNSYALLAGLSLGNKEAFDPDLRSAYAFTGAAHVLAVSGLHTGIIYAIILTLCNLLIPANSRWLHRIKQIMAISSLSLFAALAQFTPSVTRAVLMATLSTCGRMLQRPISSLQTLFATALLICVVNPAALFEVSFQLSFCAVLAILTLHPPLHRFLHPKTKVGQYVWSLLSLSTAAQIGTAGLAYYYFGTFPYLFLITNLWVIPLTGVIICLLCSWIALGALPVVGDLLLWGMEHAAWLMNQGVIWISKIL